MKILNLKTLVMSAVAMLLLPASMQAQMLWRVSGNGAKGESYLFGTHHIAPSSMMDSIKALKPSIEKADAVYGEIDMAGMETPEAQQQLMLRLQAPADSTLSRLLTPAQIDSLDNVLGLLSGGMLKATMIDAVKPSVAGVQIATLISVKEFPGFNPQQQLDQMIQAYARSHNKPIRGFETMEEQMTLLYDKPLVKQAEELMETVRNIDSETEKTKRLAASYAVQDFKDLEKMFEEEETESPEKMDELLYSRNRAWMKAIQPQIAKGSMFIAVGAGHLVGEQGLVNQLRKAGFTVEPVK